MPSITPHVWCAPKYSEGRNSKCFLIGSTTKQNLRIKIGAKHNLGLFIYKIIQLLIRILVDLFKVFARL